MGKLRSGGFLAWCAALALGLAACLAASVSPAFARVPFSAISVDARTGKLIYALDPDGLRHPASLTKMMTLYMLFTELKAGRLKMSSPITISARAAAMSPSKLGVRPGTTITVDTAIRAVVVISANDVAAAIAENLGGSESAFAQKMTRAAHAIGMTRSNFANASGLPNPNQWTSARDMATLGLRLQRDFPEYYPYFRTMAFQYKKRMVRTHNRLLGRFAGADGIKTGYTAASGFNLTSSAQRDGRRVVGVVLGASSGGIRNAYMMRMLDASFPKCTAGRTIAARAGSSAGAIEPQATQVTDASGDSDANTPDQTVKAAAKASVKVAAKVKPGKPAPASPARAVDAKQAAEATADASDAGSEDGGDGSTIKTVTAGADQPAAPAKPRVLEGKIAAGLPAKLPFQVKAPAKQSDVDAQLIGTVNADTSWHITTGPYRSKDDAVKQVQVLQTKVTPVLQGKSAFAITVKSGKIMSYRGRFTGLNEKEARAACQQILRLKQACQVEAPNS